MITVVKDISGLRFGRWSVQHFVGVDKSGNKQWLCVCKCGTTRSVLAVNLTSGDSTSCGCLKRSRTSVIHSAKLLGKLFGQLQVIERVGSTKAGKAVWLCQCSCGLTTTAVTGDLQRQKIVSCGCLKRQRSRNLAIHCNQIFGTSKSCRLFLDKLEQQFSIQIQREFYLDGRLFDGKVGRILIEVDSDYWHRSKKAKRVDALKDEIALRNGFAVVRVIVNNCSEVPKQLDIQCSSFHKIFTMRGVI